MSCAALLDLCRTSHASLVLFAGAIFVSHVAIIVASMDRGVGQIVRKRWRMMGTTATHTWHLIWIKTHVDTNEVEEAWFKRPRFGAWLLPNTSDATKVHCFMILVVWSPFYSSQNKGGNEPDDEPSPGFSPAGSADTLVFDGGAAADEVYFQGGGAGGRRD